MSQVLDNYLKNDLDVKNWNYIFFDFDHVLFMYNEYDLPENILIPFLRLMRKRKKEKKDILRCARELNYKSNTVLYLFNEIYKRCKLNSKLIKILINIKRANKNKQFIITSNNTPNFINFILMKYNLFTLFNLIHTPESAKWNWKPDKKYFLELQKKLEILNFESCLLIDDEIENIDKFKKIGGTGYHYKKDYPK